MTVFRSAADLGFRPGPGFLVLCAIGVVLFCITKLHFGLTLGIAQRQYPM
jgi:hypothetical protein